MMIPRGKYIGRRLALRRRMRASTLCGVRRAADGSIVVILLRSSTTKARCHIPHKTSRSNGHPLKMCLPARPRCLERQRRLQRLLRRVVHRPHLRDPHRPRVSALVLGVALSRQAQNRAPTIARGHWKRRKRFPSGRCGTEQPTSATARGPRCHALLAGSRASHAKGASYRCSCT